MLRFSSVHLLELHIQFDAKACLVPADLTWPLESVRGTEARGMN